MMNQLFAYIRKIINKQPEGYFEKRVREKVLRHNLQPVEAQILMVYHDGKRLKRQAYYDYLNRNARYF
ncbi:hypothetical protein GF373_11635 [bacterium]|nr:hypothetical protein [bacterium]